jgi:hypothetical protein
MSNSDTEILAFKAIVAFINDIGEIYNTKQKSLSLYYRLINKTTFNNTLAIRKNIDIFKTFIEQNNQAIINKNMDLFNKNTIQYSDNVFINIVHILKLAKQDGNDDCIWQHLTTILAILDPSKGAKKLLKDNNEPVNVKSDGSTESNFLKDIVDKVETNIDPTQNPAEALNSVMSSGVLTDLMASMTQGMENGNLDLGKLMGSVQNMVSQVTQENGNVPNELATMTQNLGNMVSSLSKQQSKN